MGDTLTPFCAVLLLVAGASAETDPNETRCPIVREFEIVQQKNATPPDWTIRAIVNPGAWVFTYPGFFRGPLSPSQEASVIRTLREGRLTNVSAVGAAVDCWYNVTIDWSSSPDRRFYVTDFGPMGGKIAKWEPGCHVDVDPPRQTCFTSDSCSCFWFQEWKGALGPNRLAPLAPQAS